MHQATHDRQVATINITPLVDVLLVLLVIFMVVAPLLETPVPMRLPQAGPERALPAPELRLRIDAAGDYALDGQPLGRAGLDAALRDALARSPGVRLRIAAAEDSDYQAFVQALSVAERAGIRNIGSEMR
jgi:biopolymer transport protein ExbD